jgi:Flp pilus assembly pilin Flp
MYLYTPGTAEALRGRGVRSWLWAADGEDREAGASALEWAIIAAISVVMATVIGAVIYNVVSTKATKVNTCAAVAANVSCAP